MIKRESYSVAVTVIPTNGLQRTAIYSNVRRTTVNCGALTIHFADGSTAAYALGCWSYVEPEL